MDSTDEFSLSARYEPKAYDFNETSVEPYMQLLDSPPLFSDKVSSADPDSDDATLEDMLHQARRAQAYHSLREDLSVSLSSSSMSDRTVRPVGDRLGRPGEHRNSEAQIRTLLDKQEFALLAECQARINQHEFKQLEPQRFNKCKEYTSKYRKIATKTLRRKRRQQHEQWDQAWDQLQHEQQVKQQHAQHAHHLSMNAERALLYDCWSCLTPRWLRIWVLSLHLHSHP